MSDKVLKIGNVVLENPFLLAPLAGITDAPMRRLARELGAAMVYSEMVSAKGLYYKDKNTERLLTIFEDEKPVAFQLFGSDPAMLEFAARELAGRENAVFDINMGCPVPKVVKNGEGSALLKDPDAVYNVVSAAVKGARDGARGAADRAAKGAAAMTADEAVARAAADRAAKDAAAMTAGEAVAGAAAGRAAKDAAAMTADEAVARAAADRAAKGAAAMTADEAVARAAGEEPANEPKPITVKIRMGFDSSHINAVEVARAAEAAGAAAVAVHGRTREQYYSGRADWDVIRRVKESVRIPVIGNGDVFTAEDAMAIMAQTGCDFVMIARGALGNPWIFAQALALWRGEELPPPPSRGDKLAMLLRHFEEALAFKGEYAAVREMRKHVGWYLKGERGSAALRRCVNNLQTAAELRAAIQSLQD